MDSSAGVPIRRRTVLFTFEDIWAAGGAGLVGGAVMGALAMAIGASYGGDIDLWTPVKQVAGAFYGPGVAMRGFEAGPVILGTLVHFAVAAGLGVVFAILYRRILGLPFQLGLPILMGAIYGLAIWGVAHIVLPTLNPVMAASEKPAFVLGHIAYGVTLGVAYARLHPHTPAGDRD